MLIWIAILIVVLLALLAEWWHAQRIARLGGLVFGRQRARGRLVTLGAATARVLGLVLLSWGLLTLWQIDQRPEDQSRSADLAADAPPASDAEPEQQLIIALDVSPSMFIRDAGPDGKQQRNVRSSEVMRSILSRLDTRKVRVTLVAFYTTALPVFVGTSDMNVVENVLAGLPLNFAFKEGPTNMYAGVREAIKLARPLRSGSTALVVISDGDTLPDADLEPLPPAISDTLVLGVGDSLRASPVGQTSSRQDVSSLKQLAVRLRGAYFDGNTQHLPSDTLSSLAMLSQQSAAGPTTRTWALAAVGLGGALLGALWPWLATYGHPRTMRAAARAVRERERTATLMLTAAALRPR